MQFTKYKRQTSLSFSHVEVWSGSHGNLVQRHSENLFIQFVDELMNCNGSQILSFGVSCSYVTLTISSNITTSNLRGVLSATLVTYEGGLKRTDVPSFGAPKDQGSRYSILNYIGFYYHSVVTIATTKGKYLLEYCLSGCSTVIETVFLFQS